MLYKTNYFNIIDLFIVHIAYQAFVPANLKKDKLTHHKPYKISAKGKAPDRPQDLLPRKCYACSEVCENAKALRHHLRVHITQPGNTKCNQCDKAYRTDGGLQVSCTLQTGINANIRLLLIGVLFFILVRQAYKC